EEGGRTFARGHRHHFAFGGEAEPMRCARGQMNQRAGLGEHRLVAVAEFDLAGDDVEGFIPVMRMRRRALPHLALLKEDFVAVRLLARGEHGELFAHDAERARTGFRRYDECGWRHGVSPAKFDDGNFSTGLGTSAKPSMTVAY